MRLYRLATAAACLISATAAFAADKTVHDKEHVSSLTYPEAWTSETNFDNTIRLKVKSGDGGLTCRVSENSYDPTAPDNPPDRRVFMEKDWSISDWQKLMASAYDKASFSLDRLAHFPDGYPVRITDMDFHYADENVRFYGHSRIALTLRRSHYGFVDCGVSADSAEEAARKWAPLADEAGKVVNSFVLDAD
ncbi:hypothetical protein EN828_02795 [Mesorhizobium sp. M2D.F.Ca.ET.185.01.1.1]|uniref:hypothetical protein n=1 Tax=unclassified Mesorhizobium TaxID=325217 RepID=UPI000FCC5A38|nr:MULTISPECIES: hypothetical protein [unclassified Mesorhizobium]TGP83531.1 hypothetical protein EN870_03095 [bacterium M00.F.Ca.ET.227.01.1.1]TGP99486.1 hypothetical protein EN864_06995 [bacterium M00.F.Ca.ET.221.01.1.1]TGQ00215.1 hypothetical protein EN865_06995 [bacterium M00.F.Ca.ET.222.01.1.1]TGU11602.1 hypothetical protein EN806_23495 [bacterium M00.F.Ca.ET.163.01.1.1]TGU35201.1 hypothetical protein EN799_19785 [bacterium M00.F.Ca.ET.156.01.1.1]TGU51547.1 hypothetical protein EN789_027